MRIIALFFASLFLVNVSFAGKSRPRSRAEAVPSDDKLILAFPNKEPIEYEKYGHFENVGTEKYRYVVTDKAGLAKAAGEGVFPNNDVIKDPAYRKLLADGALAQNHWKYVDSNTAAKNFYKWASTSEDPGVKQFFTALCLERAGLLEEAVKGFYAVAVHFPKTISWTYYDTPWYVAPSSLDRIEQILRRHPELKMKLEGAHIRVEGKFDVDLKNDVFKTTPGKLVRVKTPAKQKPIKLSKLKATTFVGGPKVQLKRFENRHWQFLVDGKPFPIRAITYSIAQVGLSPDRGTLNVSRDWQLIDTNKNGLNDGFFESYVDKNENNQRDADEPIVGDAKLLKDLGVNTLRAYHHVYDKELFRKLYKEYGLYVMCGDVFGMYAVGSGATWAEGTDYSNPVQQQNMLNSVRKMVEEYKDEPYILMWVIGNENVYGVANNSQKDPVSYFKLVNQAAELIHQLDPTRPVAISNGDVLFLDIMQQHAPALDIIGMNVYRGEHGFGRHLFLDVLDNFEKPIMITEYGASAYGDGYTRDQVEAYQSMYLANNWEDLEANMAGRGTGNVLGGVLFEFIDEWWKANSDLPEKVQKQRAEWYAPKSAIYKSLQPDKHDNVPQFGFPFIDGWSYEEWLGLVSQGDGKDSPFIRVLRPAYYTMKELWNSKK